jgi:hypothetical protein
MHSTMIRLVVRARAIARNHPRTTALVVAGIALHPRMTR